MARTGNLKKAVVGGILLAAGLTLGACAPQVNNHGYVLSQSDLEQIPTGSSREQVLVVLGTPSTTATLKNDVFYYISSQTQRRATFMKPVVTDQKVLAVYFDNQNRVERIAQYGMKDGVVFDFIDRKTVTSGQELTILSRLFSLVAL